MANLNPSKAYSKPKRALEAKVIKQWNLKNNIRKRISKGKEEMEEVEKEKEEEEEGEDSSRASRIHYLEAQVEALSEARRNLETEVVRLRAEQGDALARLRDREEGRAGNILNLETEAASLRQAKAALEEEVGRLKAEGHRGQEQRERLEDEARGLRSEGLAAREEKERLAAQLDTLTRQLD
ncbi:golgin subfamily A member 6-like protein 4, partial [Penaeus monodon]|uniref:golgin subfamily A member 6-like protein 4 n=1 Tax=Penaeus monodon TaxID=6687 RepID=UPI0018A7E06B